MRTLKFMMLGLLLSGFATVYAQDATTGATKIVVSGAGCFGAVYNADEDIKVNFNHYGFSPVFLWKLSDKLFFESEIEIQDGNMELEYGKISYSLNKYMTFGCGRMLSPFGAYGERWEPMFVERFPNSPLRADDEQLPDDTHLAWGAMMGLDVRGGIPLGSAKMNYALFISNGPLLYKDENGRPTGLIQYENLLDENNTNKELGGRIGILPFSNSSLEIGFSGKHGIAGSASDSIMNLTDSSYSNYAKIGATATAVDFNYVKSIPELSSVITVRGQYTSLTVDKADYYLNDSTNYSFDNSQQNYFAQFSIRPAMVKSKLFKNLEFLVRYGSLTAPKDAAWGAKDLNGAGGAVTRLDLGLCYWFSWRSGLRVAYEMTSRPDGTKTNELLAKFVTGF